MVVGSVVSFFAPQFAYTIMNTAVSMAAAICYGQFGAALKSLALGMASMAMQAVIKVTGFVNKAFTAVGDVIKGAVNKVAEGIGKVAEKVINVYNWVIERAREAGDWIRNTLPGNFGRALVNVAGGMVTNGISRYIGEEMDKAGNWMAKLGIGFAGALAVTPFREFSYEGWETWGYDAGDPTHTMIELTFETFSQVASNETYKALEDTLGEEWYGDLLRSSVNSVISAGFNVMKKAAHNQIRMNYLMNETVRSFEEKYDGKKIVADYWNNKVRVIDSNEDIIAEMDMLGLINARVISKGRHGRTREIKLLIPNNLLNKVNDILINSLGL